MGFFTNQNMQIFLKPSMEWISALSFYPLLLRFSYLSDTYSHILIRLTGSKGAFVWGVAFGICRSHCVLVATTLSIVWWLVRGHPKSQSPIPKTCDLWTLSPMSHLIIFCIDPPSHTWKSDKQDLDLKVRKRTSLHNMSTGWCTAFKQ